MRRSTLVLSLFLALAAAAPSRAQMTSVVNSLADDEQSYPWDDPDTPDVDESIDGVCKDEAGRCTLRAALLEASYIGAAANVTFSVTGKILIDSLSGPFEPPDGSTIVGRGNDLYISGSGPSGFQTLMGIVNNVNIEALEFRFAYTGIVIAGESNTIGGVDRSEACTVVGMGGPGIMLAGNGNIIEGNFIGISPATNIADGNKWGVFVMGVDNLIGGSHSWSRNVISGNSVSGIAIAGDTADGGGRRNRIRGNYIGTDTTGTAAAPNGYGIQVIDGVDHTIGGPDPGDGNLISGNTYGGIEIAGFPTNILVQGNAIGTNAAFSGAVGNNDGVILGPGSTSCVVADNLIRGNKQTGILVAGGAGILETSRHLIRGNLITKNEGSGILLSGNVVDNVIGSSLTVAHDSNAIRDNGTPGSLFGGGITVLASIQGEPRRNTFRQNPMEGNTPLGIYFDQANSVQDDIPPPVIATYEETNPGDVFVTGTQARPGSTIDVYAADQAPGVSAQGRRWLASWVVGADSTFTVALAAPCGCSVLVATATDPAGNTSEFSVPFTIANTTITFDINKGWNMLSVPLTVPSSSIASLFPTASGSAFSYSGAYQSATTLQRGVGYWLQFPAAITAQITGTAPAAESLGVTTGWNLVGSFSVPVPASAVTSQPPGLVVSAFFGFNNAYSTADTLMPGGAYWVKTIGPGTLSYPSGAAPARTAPRHDVLHRRE